jgi:hypothetical protein
VTVVRPLHERLVTIKLRALTAAIIQGGDGPISEYISEDCDSSKRYEMIPRCGAIFSQRFTTSGAYTCHFAVHKLPAQRNPPEQIRIMPDMQLRAVQGWKGTLASRPWKSFSTVLICCNESASEDCCDELSVQAKAYDSYLPPPKKYERKPAMQIHQHAPISEETRAWTLEISTSKPHRILYASEQISSLFKYSPHQIFNRTISTLQGPSTNAKELQAAFKSAVMLVPTILSLTLYTSEGEKKTLMMECDYVPRTEKGLIRLRARLPLCLGNEVNAQQDTGKRQNASDDKVRRHFQRQYRFRTGLAIHQAMRRISMY